MAVMSIYSYLVKYHTNVMMPVIQMTQPFLGKLHVALGVKAGSADGASVDSRPQPPTLPPVQEPAAPATVTPPPSTEAPAQSVPDMFVVISSQPSGASIFIDRRDTGLITPSRVAVPGDRPFSLRLKRLGFLDAAGATTHFVVVADAMKNQYLAAGIGQPAQYTKIFSGFALEPFLAAKNDLELRGKLGIAPGDFVIGKIARLFQLKGHDDLFAVAPELVRRNPKIKFLLVGDGEWRGRFENLAKTLGLEGKFIFTGLVPPDEVPKFVGIMDALVHLSLREGLPRALPQALAAARPVVAYDCDGAREVCLEGQTGFLIQPGDLAGLKNRLLQLADDAALREKLGRSGRQFVRENFAVENMVDAIYNLYLKLAAAGK